MTVFYEYQKCPVCQEVLHANLNCPLLNLNSVYMCGSRGGNRASGPLPEKSQKYRVF